MWVVDCRVVDVNVNQQSAALATTQGRKERWVLVGRVNGNSPPRQHSFPFVPFLSLTPANYESFWLGIKKAIPSRNGVCWGCDLLVGQRPIPSHHPFWISNSWWNSSMSCWLTPRRSRQETGSQGQQTYPFRCSLISLDWPLEVVFEIETDRKRKGEEGREKREMATAGKVGRASNRQLTIHYSLALAR